jgi:hypothetical protein
MSEVSARLVDCCMLSVFLSIAASNPFASTFLLLLSSNTGRLHLDHLQWKDDSLVVYFAHHKNDQQGKREAFCRHLLCNPFNKYVCPVFSLSLWLALDEEMTMSGGPIFPGSIQQLWFNKLFRSFLNENSQLVHACGCDPDLPGVHSFRKGGLTFLFSSSTAGPTSGSIYQRAGWWQGKVKDTYILLERAGDHWADFCRSEHPSTYICSPTSSVWLVGGRRIWCKFLCFCVFVFSSFLYVMPFTNSPTCFAILQEAITKLMERMYPISDGTPRPLIGILLKCLAVLFLHHGSII